MKTLKEEMSISNGIIRMDGIGIDEAIKKAFSDKKHRFYLNSELIDVNDRFRIIEYEENVYVIKKSSIENGIEEQEFANQFYQALNGIDMGQYKIKIILPQLRIIDNQAYIISEYEGVSLQECLYDKNTINNLKIDEIINLLTAFLERGILYRGFLPRNTIVKGNTIYLLDCEDVIFCDNKEQCLMNKLWETNFLLNWAYFYDFNELNEKILKYKGNEDMEPPLIKYEKKFGEWTNLDLDDVSLRKKIMETVFFAEKKIDLENACFCIPPNDMAHLISDIFNSDIDVLFDISSYVIRKYNETMYCKILTILSQLIVYLYKNEEDIKHYTIIIILIMFEYAASKCKKDIKFESFMDVINFNNMNDFEIIREFRMSDNFKMILEDKIKKLIELYTGNKVEQINVNELCEYLLKI